MSDQTTAHTVPTEIGGYRVVRQLGHGTRAVTVLVHADGETRVARVFGLHCPPAAIDAEVAALDAIARSDAELREHAARLDDLVTLPDGRLVLLLEQVAGPTLDDVLAVRAGGLEPGEAVTVLAPLADALEAAHRIGLTGLALHGARIRFRQSGSPVILGVREAVAGPALPQRFRATEPAYAADAAALVRLGLSVADAVAEPHRASLRAAVRAAASSRPLSLALFDLAEAQPLRLEASATVDTSRPHLQRDSMVDTGHLPSARDTVDLEPSNASASPTPPRVALILHTLLGTLRELGLPPSVLEPVRAAGDDLLARATRLASMLTVRTTAVRPRFVLAGAAGVAALALTLVLGFAPDEAPSQTASTRSAPAESEYVVAAPESAPHPSPDDWQGIVEVLLDRWEECRGVETRAEAGARLDAVLACRGQVVHRGSVAEHLIDLDDPRHALLGQWRAARGEAVIVERMGGAVLIDLVADGTTTASLLLVRSEAGWRVRDVIG